MLRRQTLNYPLLSVTLDLIGTLCSLELARFLLKLLPIRELFAEAAEHVPLPVYGLTAVIWAVVFFALSIYDPTRNYRAIDELQSVIIAALFSLLVLSGALFFSYRLVSRFLILYFFAVDLLWLIGWRLAVRAFDRYWGRRSFRTRRVLIVGTNGLGAAAAERIQQYAWTGLRLVGFVDDTDAERFVGLPLLGTLGETRAVIERDDIDEVVIALSHRSYARLENIVVDLQTLPIQVRILPNYLNLALYRATVEDFGGLPLINLRDPAFGQYQRLVKRAFDLVIGAVLTVLLLPVMAVIALAIRLDSAGPVIFKQQRVGENGRLFTMYKFRSMVTDAEARAQAVIRHDEDGHPVHKVRDDPRVTRVGRFLRRTSLDELPQLLNVLIGNMSLVGPRPEVPYLVEKYEPWQRKRFAVPQGITGWWQVNGRSDKPMHLHTEDDLYYIQNYSLLLDLQILWKTLAVVFKRQGAF